MYNRKAWLESPLTKAIRLRSGDQRGSAAPLGTEVSCNFWLPSLRLRQRVPSGMVE